MAVAAPVRYCGRCGAPLAPGAGFCGRCGTPVLAQSVPSPPAYRYAPAPPPGYPAARPAKLGPVLVAGGLIAVLIVAGLVAGGIAVSRIARSGGASQCTTNCPPKFVTPLPEQASFTSTAYRFQVNYSSRWTVRDQNAAGITLGTRLGTVQVTGSKATSPDQAIQATIAALPSSKWQSVTLAGTLRGAHLGEVNGAGAVYSANLVGTSQAATKVRIAVVAATKGGVTVVVFASDPADAKQPNGFPEGQEVDYLCTEFVWGS